MKNEKISIIIPAYNAEIFIEDTIMKIITRMNELQITNYEINLIENGSTDKTSDIVNNLAKEYKQINLIILDEADLGKAVKKGIEFSNGSFSIYMPADLSYEINFINSALEYKKKGYEVIFGSKKMKQSSVEITRSRKFLSSGFSMLVKILFRFKIKDTQGVKAFQTDLFRDYTKTFPNGFLWDIGFVYITSRKNYKWVEIPCKVVDLHKSSTIKKLRISIKMLIGLIKFRLIASAKAKKADKFLIRDNT